VKLAALALFVLLLNLPFGFWREGARRLSPTWFVAIHAPVPIVWLTRTRLGVGWSWTTLPILVGAYFAGQTLGAWLRRRRRRGRSS
jgi:hypothetical protein